MSEEQSVEVDLDKLRARMLKEPITEEQIDLLFALIEVQNIQRADANTALALTTMEFREAERENAALRGRLESLLHSGDMAQARMAAELEAARAVIVMVRWAVTNHYAPPPLCDALASYDAVTKGRAE